MDLFDIRKKLASGVSIYDLPMRVTYYARVSTDKDEQINSINNQIEYYEDLIKNCENWTYVNGYVDEGKSGTSVKNRDNFLKMIKDAECKKYDFILTKEISRFSRNTIDSIQYTQELLKSGVGVLFQSDNINTLLPDSELRLTIMSSIAQDEVRKLSERVKFGFKRAVDNGVVLGNSKMWGYDKISGKLIVNEEEAIIVRKIYDLYVNQRMGLRTIADELERLGLKNHRTNRKFAFSTLKSILNNPKYKGYYCGNKTSKIDYRMNDRKFLDKEEWTMYKDVTGKIVPQIVSEEIWEKAQELMEKRGCSFKGGDLTRYSNRYTYSSKIVCMEHQTAYHRKLSQSRNGNKKEYWVCREYANHGRNACNSPLLYTSELNEIMKICIDEMILNKTDIIQEMIDTYKIIVKATDIDKNISECNFEIEKILLLKDKLLELNLEDKITNDEFGKRNDNYNLQIGEFKDKIKELKDDVKKNSQTMEALDAFAQIIGNKLKLEEISHTVIENLLDRIEVHKSDDPNIVNIVIALKLMNEKFPVALNKNVKNTFRYDQYTLYVTKGDFETQRRTEGRYSSTMRIDLHS